MSATITFKILWVEDEKSIVADAKEWISVFNKKNNCHITFDSFENTKEASEHINESHTFALVDLKIGRDQEAGKKFIENIQTNRKIPIAVYTGTPSHAEGVKALIGTFTKDEGLEVVIGAFVNAIETGIPQALGEGGLLDQVIRSIFWDSISPDFSTWISYTKIYGFSKNIVLRHAIAHLIDAFDLEEKNYFPAEFYISQKSHQLNSGSIYFPNETSNERQIVLSPPCDVAPRDDGSINTDYIILAPIEDSPAFDETKIKSFSAQLSHAEPNKREKAGNEIAKISGNSDGKKYRHYVPKMGQMHDGFINFRKIYSLGTAALNANFRHSGKQVSPVFMKDILSRFSSYFGQQGQPDINPYPIIYHR